MSKQEIVARTGDLDPGTMKQVAVGNTDVLLVRLGDQYKALGAHCTHYGAPLVDGVLHGNRLVCPWHHACFAAQTGAMLEPPALDSLPQFEVQIDGEEILVTVPEHDPQQLPPEMANEAPSQAAVAEHLFVIAGAGAAGAAAAERLRQLGYNGRLVLLTRESALPYDRTLLSKAYLKEEEKMGWIPMRSMGFYRSHDIDIQPGAVIKQIDTTAKIITFEDGEMLSYDKLLLALGSIPQIPEIEGRSLQNVFVLRSLRDSENIIAAAQNEDVQKAVIVGSSFIGMECAANLLARDLDVTVVSLEKTPYEAVLGPEIGRMFQRLHEEQGVNFVMDTSVKRLKGNGRVQTVELKNGTSLAADLVVLGTGVRPNTEMLKGVTRNDDGSVTVDETLKVQDAEDVWAAGDLAQYPDAYSEQEIRVEHWRLALQHGRTAAENMMGQRQPFMGVPFFWTNQYSVRVRYVGYAPKWDELIIHGDLANSNLLAYYVKDGRILAALGAGHDKTVCAVHEVMYSGKMPTVEAVRNPDFDWEAQLASEPVPTTTLK